MKTEKKSRMQRLFEKGEFVVTAELGPPKSLDFSVLDRKIDLLSGVVDAVNLTDNQTAIARISSIAAGLYVMKAGLEPVIQMACRDRNRLAIQADLLGACLHGITNVLCLTGDHQCMGNHPGAKHVFDIDSIQLIQIVKNMRDKGVFQNGDEIRNSKKSDLFPPYFFIGGAANPFAEPFEWRVSRLEKKIEAGIDFIQTQCIYDMDRFGQWMKEVVDRGLHKKAKIMAGITPIKSLGMARYMRDNVAGVTVPDSVIQRMEKVENVKEEGIKFAVEQIRQFREMEGIAGVHIMAIEWEDAVKGMVESSGLLPRPKVS
ncbi:MAG: methylenetetrahydrofolate reductase [Spirochaetales bacterium]|nr:methylenetetrahydrofolate reductase [Spirochaetales bacterium]